MSNSIVGIRETISDGGPAFACVALGPSGDAHLQEGMSLRDWFAGQALKHVSLMGGYDAAAVDAYQIADAMLAERAKATQP